MRYRVYPYHMGSRSARALARSLNGLRVREAGRYRPRASHVLINWGNPRMPAWVGTGGLPHWLNVPLAVAVAGNKLSAFNMMSESSVRTVPYTPVYQEALAWHEEGSVVVARSLLRGHSGEGITIVNPDEPLPRVPLYTKYVKKMYEYRLHVMRGEVFHVQQKRRMNTERRPEGFSNQVRSHQNGWVYTTEDLVEPNNDCVVQAIVAVRALGLDFGAVDLIYNQRLNENYVLEVNTAPGLEGRTLSVYTQEILRATMG